MRRQTTRGQPTRAALIDAARRLLAEHGYSATTTDAVLELAGVSRGSLYHHFGDKLGLLRAVCAELFAELATEISGAASSASDTFEGLVQGSEAFLRGASRPEVSRILFVDGAAALGWPEINRLDQEHGTALLRVGIQQAVDEGVFPALPIDSLTAALSGMLNELAVFAANGNAATKRSTVAVARAVLEGLRVDPR